MILVVLVGVGNRADNPVDERAGPDDDSNHAGT